ncbi:hypothetical protein [Pedobacter nyackensis]|uniref:hypothetical protein n=1 Tax=Pedobacter nyackensis TaxID=475255 RepID=UPI002931A419|nr:hypothetical protein [Pedobacter nyackensis]
MKEELKVNKCEFCGITFPLGSRNDKRFCGDTCRNSFNKKKKAEGKLPVHKNKSEILKIIKRNYEFLRKHAPQESEDEYTYVEIERLKDWKEFNPKFYTNVKLINNRPWYFCFDLGFSISDSIIEFINIPEQANILDLKK